MGHKDMVRVKKDGSAQVIALMNQKGGVGKTTTAINLAAALGELGRKVLVVDFDPQGNTTSGFGADKNSSQACIYDAILCDEPVEDVIVQTGCPGVFLAPATLQLAGAEVELVSVIAREMRLRDALLPVYEDFDYIFIDCPPSLGVLTINALVAATSVLIPVQCEFYALEGVTKLLEAMKMVKSRINHDLEVFGALLTMFDARTLLSKQVAQEVEGFFGDKVFKTMIPRNVRLSEAPSYGMSVLQYDPDSKGAQAYRDLAIEVTQRG